MVYSESQFPLITRHIFLYSMLTVRYKAVNENFAPLRHRHDLELAFVFLSISLHYMAWLRGMKSRCTGALPLPFSSR